MFPIITKLSDLLPHIEGNSQIRVKTCDDTGHTVVCYMLQDEETFAGEKMAFERECRGISFDKDGNISARPLHKFFNVGEREDLQPHVIDWAAVSRIMEKRDGSMVTPVLVDGFIRFKTKKSFTNFESELAEEIVNAEPGGMEWCGRMLTSGLTPIFELTSPKCTIVVPHEVDEMTLLHVRENATGRYLSPMELHELDAPFEIVQSYDDVFADDGYVSWEKLKAAVDSVEGMEGWVLQFSNGDMLKLKTTWYNKLHRAVTFTRWRDIARAVCAGEGDDLKGMFSMCSKPIAPIQQVEATVRASIEEAARHVFQIVRASAGMEVKDVAISNKGDPLFSLIMAEFRGKEIDYMEWYVKSRLEADWGLEVAQ